MQISEYIKKAHWNAVDKGFWDDEIAIIEKMQSSSSFTKEHIEIVKSAFRAQRIALLHSELSEMLEADRKGEDISEEVADEAIRLFDFCGGESIDLQKAIDKKMEKNGRRPYKHGKRY